MSRIIMITGGQRSGKSAFAESKVLELAGDSKPVYIATARLVEGDDEFERRVAAHRVRRGEKWTTIEEPLHVSTVDIGGRVALIDCLTLLATNAFFECDCDVERSAVFVSREIAGLMKADATIVVVTNEVGLGGTSSDAMQRGFNDLQGAVNMHLASLAEEVYIVVSGIPVKIK